MEKLSRINKYADLRNSLENSRESSNNSKELEKFAETLSNIDENNFSKMSAYETNNVTRKNTSNNFLDEVHEEANVDTNNANIESTIDKYDFDSDDFLNNFIKEIEKINLSKGLPSAIDTQNKILDDFRGYTKEEVKSEPILETSTEELSNDTEVEKEEDDNEEIAQEVERIISESTPFQPDATPIIPIIDDDSTHSNEIKEEVKSEPILETSTEELSDDTEVEKEETNVDAQPVVSENIEDTLIDDSDIYPTLNNDENESTNDAELTVSEEVVGEEQTEETKENVELVDEEKARNIIIDTTTVEDNSEIVENKVNDNGVAEINEETKNINDAQFDDEEETLDATLLNETIPLQVDDIKTNANNSSIYDDKPNVILNIVLVILILILVAVLLVIGYWILNIKGVI